MVKKAVVTVKDGKVCGIKTTSSFSGMEYYAFYGIPYGQPTTNHLRFRDPVKVKPWKNVYDATTQKDGCLQFALITQQFSGTEDCLYNNVYTSKLPSKDDLLKPVVVCIHPGGYFHGSPDPWYYGSPEYVMHQDIVYVCIGYRLHILGFLNLELEECSGNQGLKDVILGLKWIQENISVFGGDPENVTILGSSSGSSMVHYLMLSPVTKGKEKREISKAKGLFHKAVMMGIHVFDPTLIVPEESHLSMAYRLACIIGYEGKDPNDKKKLLSFYKKIKIDEIIMLRSERNALQESVAVYPASLFRATVDSGKNAVLPATSPRELMATMSRVPLVFGICEKEAAMAFARPLKQASMEHFYSAYLQSRWSWAKGIGKEEVDIIGERIRSFYLNGQSIHTASINTLIDILTDMVNSDVYDTLINLVSADLPSSVFVYKFKFEGNALTMKDTMLRNLLEEPLEGTCHAADFSYWAEYKEQSGVRTETLNVKSVEIVEMFTKLITTFARTGDPNYDGLNIVWRPSPPDNPCYLIIDDPLQLVDGKLNGKRMEFWEKLKKEFRKN